MKEPTPIVTDTDRQRGWAEIEIELLDGTHQFVRVHALDQSDLVHLAKHPAADALNEAVAKSLRADKAFVARISQHDLVAVSATLAFLTHGDVAGDAIVSQAATSVFESSKSTAQSALAEMMACGKSLRDQLAAMPKLPEMPSISAELRALMACPCTPEIL